MNAPRCTLVPGAEGYRRKAVRAIAFDMDRLVVEIQGEGFSYLRVIFREVECFRALDERDLSEFWHQGYGEKTGWLYEVHAGGWRELELTRPEAVSLDVSTLTEFLLVDDTCLSVLCGLPPEIVEVGSPPRPPANP